MNLEKKLEKYADLLVNIGLNLKPGDKLAIRFTDEALPLVRIVSKKAYQKGVIDVKLDFSDDEITLQRYLNAPDVSFETFPEYEVDYR